MGNETGLYSVMTRGIISIEASVPVLEAMKKMFNRRVTSLIVKKDDNGGYCIITRKDIVSKVIARGKDPKDVKVEDIMSKSLKTVSPDEDIRNVARLMTKSGIRRFGVEENKRLVGMVSNGDIIKAETIRLLPTHRRYSIINLKKRFSQVSGKEQPSS